MKNKDNRIIGYDKISGFPIYDGKEKLVNDFVKEKYQDIKEKNCENCFFAGIESSFCFIMFLLLGELAFDFDHVFDDVLLFLMVISGICAIGSFIFFIVCLISFFKGKKNSISWIGIMLSFLPVIILIVNVNINNLFLTKIACLYFVLQLVTLLFIKNRINIFNKKKMYITFSITISISLFTIGYTTIYKNDFSNSIYVITKEKSGNAILYYEVNDRRNTRKVDKFECNNEIIYLKGCFNSYLDHKKNKVLNKYNKMCQVVDSNYNHIKNNKDVDSIIKLMAKLEHGMIEPKIIKTKNNYYVVVPLDVNWQSPYDLYKYENNKLKFIYTFESEDIIGIKDDSSKYCFEGK